MHDIGQTQMEYNQEQPGFETGFETGFEAEEFEYGQGEWEAESGEFGEFGELLSEADEMELANELLSVSSEAELDQFLGNLLKKVSRAAGKVIRSPIGRAVGGVLKGVAKKALPLAGGAIGGYFGGPLGAKIGSGLARAGGKALGLEAEMLEQEDLEFEGARQYVRLAANTVKKATSAPANVDPRSIAQSAAIAAVKQFAPGLLGKGGTRGGMSGATGQGQTGRGQTGRGQTGRWMRRANKIVLYGV
ncbi:hypothetical protein [Nitrosospira sp. Nsp1]|uniref:hypothetical protein n=1 Tax=Nitrosospira sp. Nsp1 TaxID=136547 RepID=UPI000883389F|nr:hypothetical protein [Nitrosospira sp. Nsp1]SCX40946.1 hypothetical protein SAMN05720354_103182 [Nitrosospira sp. Nsp1]